MTTRHRTATIWLALLVAMGCASVEVTDRERYDGPQLSRPGRILVHDFAVVPDDIPAWAAARYSYVPPDEPLTAEEIEKGRELGSLVAEKLVEEIQQMGLPGARAGSQPPPEEGDLVFVGYFGSLDEGSRLKRVVVGFGSGAPELETHIEAYGMQQGELRKLGGGATDSGGTRGPGVALPAIVSVATANPIGLAIGGAVKGAGELTGHSTIEGSAERTAKQIGKELRGAFERQGWIEKE